MSNYRDIESAYLVGKAKYEKWRDEFEADFLEPLVEDMLRRELMKQISPDMMVKLAEKDKAAFDSLAKFLGAGGE